MKSQGKGTNKSLAKVNQQNKRSPTDQKDRYEPPSISEKAEIKDPENIYPVLLSKQRNLNTTAQLKPEVPVSTKRNSIRKRETSLSLSCRGNSSEENFKNRSPEKLPSNPRYCNPNKSNNQENQNLTENKESVKKGNTDKKNTNVPNIISQNPENPNIISALKNDFAEESSSTLENLCQEIPFMNTNLLSKSFELVYIGNNKFILKSEKDYSNLQKTISYYLYKYPDLTQKDQYQNFLKTKQKDFKEELSNIADNVLNTDSFKNSYISKMLKTQEDQAYDRTKECSAVDKEKQDKLSVIQSKLDCGNFLDGNKFELMKSYIRLKNNKEKYNKARKTFKVLDLALNNKVSEAMKNLKGDALTSNNSNPVSFQSEKQHMIYVKNREVLIKNFLLKIQQSFLTHQKIGFNKLFTDLLTTKLFNKYHKFWNNLMNANKKWNNKQNYAMRILKNFRRLKGSVKFEPSSDLNSYKTETKNKSSKIIKTQTNDLNLVFDQNYYNEIKQNTGTERNLTFSNNNVIESDCSGLKKRKSAKILQDSPNKSIDASSLQEDFMNNSSNFKKPSSNKNDKTIEKYLTKQSPNRRKKLNVKLTDTSLSNNPQHSSETFLITSDVSGKLNVW